MNVNIQNQKYFDKYEKNFIKLMKMNYLKFLILIFQSFSLYLIICSY